MIFERARVEDKDDVAKFVEEAKRDYENAVNRFNCANSESMTSLAIFDMNTAMKRYCFIMDKVKNGEYVMND